MSEIYYATHDGNLFTSISTITSSTVIDSIEFIVHRRSRWQRFLHALTTPLRIRLVVRP